MSTRLTYHAADLCHNPQLTPDFAADYTPYGPILRSLGTERYLTTQHERDTETDLDYRGARFYDSDGGRFLSLDPMAAKYLALGAYVYVAGNPVRYVDPDGKKVEDHIYVNKKGEIIKRIVDPSINKVTIVTGTVDFGLRIVAIGKTYNVDGLIKTFDISRKDICQVDEKGYVTNDPPGGEVKNRITDGNLDPKRGISREHGTYAYVNKRGEVEYRGDVRGTPTGVFGDRPKGSVANGHSHPNEDKGVYKLGQNGEYGVHPGRGPSGRYDLNGEKAPDEDYFNAMIDDKSIYFYDRKGTIITVPRSELQSKNN